MLIAPCVVSCCGSWVIVVLHPHLKSACLDRTLARGGCGDVPPLSPWEIWEKDAEALAEVVDLETCVISWTAWLLASGGFYRCFGFIRH